MFDDSKGRVFIKRMWEKQMCCCPVCGKHITDETTWMVKADFTFVVTNQPIYFG